MLHYVQHDNKHRALAFVIFVFFAVEILWSSLRLSLRLCGFA
jgi:hypothetical protein